MPTVLVLGGYGLIGAACCRALEAAGFDVIGLGRSRAAAMAVAPDRTWIFRDLASLETPEWRDILGGVDVVVNAAGALQDGPRDDLEGVHATMPARLVAAAPPEMRLVQVSAAGVSAEASTAFFRSKARGDAHVAGASCDWVILRPSLVLAPEAYGGTALLRGAAACPGVLPVVLPGARIQTVHVEDLAAAVVACARGEIAPGTIADISAAEAHTLPALMEKIRAWQGFPAPRLHLRVPDAMLAPIGRLADLPGWLGWRSPLRTTALAVLRDGVHADPGPWVEAGGAPPRELAETLAALPSTRQERLFARLYFVVPLAIAVLSLFWLVSGIVGFARPAAAASVLEGRGLPGWGVYAMVLGGACVDMLLGAAVLSRAWCRRAALGMIVVSLAYLAGGTLFVPGLWLDPLGPLVKVVPSIVLALVVWLGVEER